MESYFQKIDSLSLILLSLDAVNDEDVVHYALEGLLRTNITMFVDTCIGRTHFQISKRCALVNSPERDEIEVSLGSCFSFAKGSCRFGDSCRYVHDANARVSNANSGFNKGRETSENTTHDLLNKLLSQLGHLGMNVAMSNNGTNVTLPNPATVTPTVIGPNIASTVPTAPHAFYASPGTSLGPNPTPPPGFPPLAQAHLPYYGYTAASTPTHLTPPAVGPVHTTMGPVNYATQPTGSLVMGSASSSGAVNTLGQATLLPQAFIAGSS
ncbi:ribonuclease H-like domain-containing protein [Tanacetum coccineum]